MSDPGTSLVAVDWGTSNLRAWRLDAAGDVLDARADDRGIARIERGGHERVLRALVGDWLAPDPEGVSVVAFGMVTSRDGWVEVPYVPCPFDAASLAEACLSRTLDDGVRVRFVPGARDASSEPFPDVMRGEETQLVGCETEDARTVVLPGTHGKWARIEEGAVRGFRTVVTGELHGVLVEHAFIGRGDDRGNGDDVDDGRVADAFIDAVEHARDRPDGLLAGLFDARTGVLAGRLAPGDVREYLSGALIGHEMRDALAAGRCERGETLLIVGDGALAGRYARAAERFGLRARIDAGLAGVRGAFAVAQHLETRP